MKLSRLIPFLLIIFCAQTVSFAQEDDEPKRKKRSSLFVPKSRKSSGVKKSKNRDDLFRDETFKSSKETKKQQAKKQRKKHKKRDKKYKKTRGEMQNQSTSRRMKRNERKARKFNQGRTVPLIKRIGSQIKPSKSKRISKERRRRSNQLRERQNKASEKYESSYTPTSRKKKKDKLRSFFNPFKRNR